MVHKESSKSFKLKTLETNNWVLPRKEIKDYSSHRTIKKCWRCKCCRIVYIWVSLQNASFCFRRNRYPFSAFLLLDQLSTLLFNVSLFFFSLKTALNIDNVWLWTIDVEYRQHLLWNSISKNLKIILQTKTDDIKLSSKETVKGW